MFDIKDLLGMVMQSGMTGSGNRRMRHALGESGVGGGNGLLSGLFGGGAADVGGLARMAAGMLGGGQTGSGGMAAGGIGALAERLLGGGGGRRNAMGGGLMALLGSLAVSALQGMNRPRAEHDGANLPLGLREPQTRAEAAELDHNALLVLRAMLNAAKADGQMDPAEIKRITGKLEEAGADSEARHFILDEMGKPADLDALLREIRNPEVGAQIYAASLLAIEVDTPAEQAYLQRLAQGAGLDDAAVARLHQMLGVEPTA